MLFSVIVPVYNGERYLPDCLASLANQSCQDFEVLVVDDGRPTGPGGSRTITRRPMGTCVSCMARTRDLFLQEEGKRDSHD